MIYDAWGWCNYKLGCLYKYCLFWNLCWDRPTDRPRYWAQDGSSNLIILWHTHPTNAKTTQNQKHQLIIETHLWICRTAANKQVNILAIYICYRIIIQVIVFYFPSEFSFLFLFLSHLPDTVYELYLGTWHSNIQHTLGQPALYTEKMVTDVKTVTSLNYDVY